jgi:hypothetical protein
VEREPREELAFWLSMSVPDLGGGESGVATKELDLPIDTNFVNHILWLL